MKWARVAELEMELEGKMVKYCATPKIYSDIGKYGVDCGQLGAE
ncbi:MAG TPA: hypothetical protein VN833_02310 [Candidatus Acidoferrales bacterium]|jgi:hypothetical protein|nr:hypothetical protein [Candidatus Acidoferrales bacterium]